MTTSSMSGCLPGSLLPWFLFEFSPLLGYQDWLTRKHGVCIWCSDSWASPLAPLRESQPPPCITERWNAPAKTIDLLASHAGLDATFFPAPVSHSLKLSLPFLQAFPALAPLGLPAPLIFPDLKKLFTPKMILKAQLPPCIYNPRTSFTKNPCQAPTLIPPSLLKIVTIKEI